MDMKRYDLIDTLRGLAVISMIGYHACWILNLFGLAFSNDIIYGTAFTVWERSICMSFITIAGFSFSLGHRHLKNGLVVFGLGAAITAVTLIFLPEIRIVFGVLTFLGSATLIMIPLDALLRKRPAQPRSQNALILALCLILFVFTYNINKGFAGFGKGAVITLPAKLYSGYAATFIGFTERGFASADYFSLIPWFFLYLCGYFLHKLIRETTMENTIRTCGIPGISLIGRHSLLIYIIHPVVLYAVIYLLSYCIGR